MKKEMARGKLRKVIAGFMIMCALFSFALTAQPRLAYALACTLPTVDAGAAGAIIAAEGVTTTADISALFSELATYIEQQFESHKKWLTTTFFDKHVHPALVSFADQMSVIGMHQMFVIGTFFDAKQQLETQRTVQKLSARAHKDYQPSEDFCWFGTNARSLASSESMSKYVSGALSARALSRHLGNSGSSASFGREQDYAGRWRKFTRIYCDPKDNNWQDSADGSGLEGVCNTEASGTDMVNNDAPQDNRRNRDIDYTRLVDAPRTITDFVEFRYDGGGFNTSGYTGGTRDDIFALANNLYGHKVRNVKDTISTEQAQLYYLGMRSVAAKRSVAENSFNAIVGLKASGTSDMYSQRGHPAGGSNYPADGGTAGYLGAVFKELGYSEQGGFDSDIIEMIGRHPSYYVQLEVLAKKIYQNPDFYANLYDTPANVARKKVALRAIELMLDRAIYESQIRQEMVMSVLLSSKLRGDFRDINAKLQTEGQ